MSALVERIIAARDSLKSLDATRAMIHDARDVMAEAANAIVERDKTIEFLRQKITDLRAPASITLEGSGRHVASFGMDEGT